MAMDTKSSAVKIRQMDSSSKGKFDSSFSKRKFESSGKQVVESKPRIVSTAVKSEVKSKSTVGSSSSKVTTTTTTTKKTTKSTTTVKQKKVYTLAGQKYDPPEEREPLRIFYESLWKQIPTSEMAEFWMMEHGMLSPERAKKAHEKKQRRQKEIRSGTPIKSYKPPSRAESSKKPMQQVALKNNGDTKAKKRMASDSDDDGDFISSPKRRKS